MNPTLREMQAQTGFRVSYQRAGTAWKGVLKDASGRAVWVCDHRHKNRDNGTVTFGPAAFGCARNELFRRFKCEAA